jgi:hypothetical protein
MNLRVLAVLTSLTSGCSFIFSSGPPAQHEQMPYFDCTSTFGLPVADGVFALGGAVAAGTTLSQSEAEYKLKNDNKGNRNAAAGINIAMAAVFAASAIYGIVQANRCDTAKGQLRGRIMTPILTPPLRPPVPALPPPPPLPAPAPAAPEVPPAVTPAPPPG